MNKYIKYLFFAFVFVFYHFSIGQSLKDSIPIDKDKELSIRKLPSNFKENYKGDEFTYEYNFDAQQKSIWEQFKMWLSHKFKEWFGFADTKKASEFTGNFIKIIYIIVILIVLYFIIKTLLNKEGNWVFGRSTAKINIHATNLDENILITDYDNLIIKAKQKEDYRLAIRYSYLKSLKKLAEFDIIEWDYEKTNSDYYREIKNLDLKNQFQYISYIYNYCWYGEFNLNHLEYIEAENSFNKLINSIRK